MSYVQQQIQAMTLLREQAFFDGTWVEAQQLKRFAVRDPATDAVLGTVPDMAAADAERAIAAAERALPQWRGRTAKERAAILRRWCDYVLKAAEDLALLVTAEQGKPLAEARAEITYAAAFIEWYAEEARRIYGDIIPTPAADRRIFVVREPIGVCAAITPWNYPAAMVTRKVAPALAAGCTIVLKPAELTPYSALALAELAAKAGLPAGVFNVITTNDPAGVGATLCASPTVRHISFTGSTEVGKSLLRQASGTVKKCAMELGGNAPFIVFEDADLEAALTALIAAKFRNAGQTCVCPNRIFVHSAVHDRFATLLSDRVAKFRIGNGRDAEVTMGPLIEAAAADKIERHIEDALSRGARRLTGGKRYQRGGTYFPPTVLADVTTNMVICQEETFGPVAALIRYTDEDDVLSMANDSRSGLAAYVYTNDVKRMFQCAERFEYGVVGINTGMVSNEVAPFGGVKESGLGREGSRYGIEEYVQIKYVCVGGL